MRIRVKYIKNGGRGDGWRRHGGLPQREHDSRLGIALEIEWDSPLAKVRGLLFVHETNIKSKKKDNCEKL